MQRDVNPTCPIPHQCWTFTSMAMIQHWCWIWDHRSGCGNSNRHEPRRPILWPNPLAPAIDLLGLDPVSLRCRNHIATCFGLGDDPLLLPSAPPAPPYINLVRQPKSPAMLPASVLDQKSGLFKAPVQKQGGLRRRDTLQTWTRQYNWNCLHGSLNSMPPITRVALSEDNLLRLHR